MHVKLSLNLYFHCKNKKFLLYLAVIKRTIYHTKKHTMTLKPFYAKLKSLAKLPIGLVSVFLIFNTHTAISQIQDKQTVQDSTEDNQIHFLVQEMPVFPGNLNTWIYNNIRYPETAKEKKLEGKVYVRFVIEKDGAISNVKVIRGVSPELDNEAKAVIASMPKWEPGKQNGSPVRVSYTVPVYFALRSTSPSIERRTFDRYLKALNTEEEKLKNGLDTVPQASFDMYRLYLKKRYGTDKAVYKGIITSAREQQQSSEIMLSIIMPTMSLPVSDKNKILQFYKEEWDEQIRLIDSLPTEDFTSEYIRITPRFRANTTLREIKIRDYLGEKKFKRYVEDCIFNPGKLIRAIIANPFVGKWEKVTENGVATKQLLQKEYFDDFTFSCSNGVNGTYKITHGQFLSEHAPSVKIKDIVESSAHYQYDANNRILVLTGEAKLKLADGTHKNVQVKETWRRIE